MWQLFSKERNEKQKQKKQKSKTTFLFSTLEYNVWDEVTVHQTDHIGAIFSLLWCYVIFSILYCLNGIVDSCPSSFVQLCRSSVVFACPRYRPGACPATLEQPATGRRILAAKPRGADAPDTDTPDPF